MNLTLSNGKQLEVTFKITTEIDGDFNVETDLEDERDKEAVRSGEYTPMNIMVTAMAARVEGWDSLGGCLVKTESDVKMYMDDHQMKDQAIQDLRVNLEAQLTALGV